jgi:hypothetical protein
MVPEIRQHIAGQHLDLDATHQTRVGTALALRQSK